MEDVIAIFKLNAKSKGYVFCPPHSGMDKKGVFAVTAGSFGYSLQSASDPCATEAGEGFSHDFAGLWIWVWAGRVPV